MKLLLENKEIRRCRPILGTFVEIAVDHDDDYIAHQAINAAFAEVERIQKLMNFYDVHSEVSVLNRSALYEDIRVSPEIYHVLRVALNLYKITEGVFDITAGSKLINEKSLSKGTSKDIQFKDDFFIRFLNPLVINLGGIAKGFAVDQAIDILQKNGIQSGIVNAGGDLRCFGYREQQVGIKSSIDSNLFSLTVINTAVATSSVRSSKSEGSLTFAQHVQMPSRKVLNLEKTVSVIAKKCIWADALTKVVLLADKKTLENCLSFYQAKALVFNGDGELLEEIG